MYVFKEAFCFQSWLILFHSTIGIGLQIILMKLEMYHFIKTNDYTFLVLHIQSINFHPQTSSSIILPFLFPKTLSPLTSASSKNSEGYRIQERKKKKIHELRPFNITCPDNFLNFYYMLMWSYIWSSSFTCNSRSYRNYW